VKKLSLVILAGAAVTIAGCSGNKAGNNSAAANNSISANGSAAANGTATGDMAGAGGAGAAGAGAAGASGWTEGSRIVEEGGVTYRVDASGARVRLEPGDSRIVVEKGVRYRVDAGGTRVRIDQRGAAVKVGESTITGNAPNGRSDRETPGEAATDVAEDAAEAVGDLVPD
jgi:hypothetical protein